MHVNPEKALIAGYGKATLQSNCLFGIVARVIYDYFCEDDPLRFKSFKARFYSAVFPGDTIKIRVWLRENLKYVEVIENKQGKRVLQGVAEIRVLAKL